MSDILENLSSFQKTEFIFDSLDLEKDEKERVCRILREVYNNDVEDQFLVHNPVVLIKSDYGSASRVAQELDVKRGMISNRSRSARSILQEVLMLSADFDKDLYNKASSTQLTEIFETSDADLSYIEEIECALDAVHEETLVEYRQKLGDQVKRNMLNESKTFCDGFTDEQLNTTISKCVEVRVTRDAIKEETRNLADIGKDTPKNEFGIPRKVEEAAVQKAQSSVVEKLQALPYFLASYIAPAVAKPKDSEQEQKFAKPEPPRRSSLRRPVLRVPKQPKSIKKERVVEPTGKKLASHFTESSESE